MPNSQISPTAWPNTTLVERGDKKLYLVGTAHISLNSVREVEAVIDTVRPDTVCVELCKMRHEAMTDESRWRRLDIFQVLKQKKAMFLMANLALSAYQRRLGAQLGVKPGAELMAGVQRAEAVGAQLVLADRDIQVTLKRTWANLGFWGRNKILAGLMAGIFGATEEMTEAELEQMKDRDTLTEKMKEFAVSHPKVKEPLIDERDLYLISSIREAPGNVVVAVVGAGHVPGMLEQLDTPVDRARPAFLGTSGYGPLDNVSVLERFEAGAARWSRDHRGSVVELHAYACDPAVVWDRPAADALDGRHGRSAARRAR